MEPIIGQTPISPGKAPGTWVIISNNANKYIARTLVSKAGVITLLNCGESLKCEEVIDYGCPMQVRPMPDHSTQVGKFSYSSRIDSTLHACTVYISLSGATLYFMDDLNQKLGDTSEYEELIKTARDASEGAYKDRVHRNSGLILATGLPGAGVGGPRY